MKNHILLCHLVPEKPNGEYRSVSYYGEIKNPQELNVKNSFDLIEYLKPCLVYIASDNNKVTRGA